jgi:ssRNA-specific RNase YbeY (16S rRNA maturation enzyme)
MLHLLGYDHEQGGQEAEEMREMEEKILKACNL